MIKEKLKIFYNKILNLLFPHYSCIICSRELESPTNHICNECEKQITKIEGNQCVVCGEPIPAPNAYCDNCKDIRFEFDKARAVYIYDKYMAVPIGALKYNGKRFLAEIFAQKLHNLVNENEMIPDIIIPVPLTKTRETKRGYNQSLLLAESLCSLVGGACYVDNSIVLRIKDVPPQVTLKRKDRIKNLDGVFKLANKAMLKGKTVLIIDDVFTTGTTANEVSKQLRNLNPKKIYVATIAKTILNNSYLSDK